MDDRPDDSAARSYDDSPVPFGHIVPAFLVMLLAISDMEEDGLALLVSLLSALASLAITAATVWGTIVTIDWLDPASRT